MKKGAIISFLSATLVFFGIARPSLAAPRAQSQNCSHSAIGSAAGDFLNPLPLTPARKAETNLWLCLSAYADCNPALLTPSELAQDRQASRWRNLLTCETSLGDCDHSKLTPSQAAEVRKIERDQNLADCETGDGICDASLLTAAQSAEVNSLQRERNVLSCETGDALCDDNSLTPADSKQVSIIQHQRNLLACQTGEDYCDTSLLTPAEARQVAAANLDASSAAQTPCAATRSPMRTANQAKPGAAKS